MSTFKVRQHHGAPTLLMAGQPIFAAIYLTVRNFRGANVSAERLDDPYLKQFRDAGFHLYSAPLPVSFDGTYDPATGEFPAEGFAPLEILSRYAELDPQARFLLRVGTAPRGDQSAWIKRYPQECEVLESRAKGTYLTPSYASQQWLRDAEVPARAHQLHLCSRPG